MNKKLLIPLALLILTIGFVGYTQLLKPKLDNRVVSAVVPMQITSAVAPISFTYPSGADALALIEPPVPADSLLKKIYLLMNNQDYTIYSTDTDGGVPPPSISVFVFAHERSEAEVDLDRMTRLQNWAKANPQYSSWFAASSEPVATNIDGATALRYQTESTYKQDVYLISYKKNIIVITGQYEAAGDEIQLQFEAILETVLLN